MRTLIPLVVVLIVGLVMAGCASSSSYPGARESPTVRTRCLTDRGEGSTRPIIFLFCAESP